MNTFMRYNAVMLLTCLFGCSDGTQVSQRITGIINERNDDRDKKNDIHYLSFEFEGDIHTFKVDPKSDNIRSVISDQFLTLDDVSVNLAGVKTIQARNDTLYVSF